MPLPYFHFLYQYTVTPTFAYLAAVELRADDSLQVEFVDRRLADDLNVAGTDIVDQTSAEEHFGFQLAAVLGKDKMVIVPPFLLAGLLSGAQFWLLC